MTYSRIGCQIWAVLVWIQTDFGWSRCRWITVQDTLLFREKLLASTGRIAGTPRPMFYTSLHQFAVIDCLYLYGK